VTRVVADVAGELPCVTQACGLKVLEYDLGSGVLGVTVDVEASRASDATRAVTCPSSLKAALSDERYPHWFITLTRGLDDAALDMLASWFPRRVAVGKVAVVCARSQHMQGVILAAAITIPLVPRPVRIFTPELSHHAWVWIASETAAVGLPRGETARSLTLPS
jgi:hypothetical protein